MAFSSGLGATTTIMMMLKSGDHVIVMDDVYGGDYIFLVASSSVQFKISCLVVTVLHIITFIYLHSLFF